ncbi:hypothetical protein ACQKL5_12175 [Peribacillus sp. NPDC097675]|uniref:hypothetical protein n=1 Tax=Peribacillus sp. NPDC097675 TaxID=3390618 RepID=UPI003D01594E
MKSCETCYKCFSHVLLRFKSLITPLLGTKKKAKPNKKADDALNIQPDKEELKETSFNCLKKRKINRRLTVKQQPAT